MNNPPVVRSPGGAAANACNNAQTVKEVQPYYSVIRLATTRALVAAGPPATYTYTVPAGRLVTAFSYSQNGDMTAAGYAAGLNATAAETNLTSQKFKTNSGHTVYIYGVAIEPSPTSNPALLAQLFNNCSMVAKFNGVETVLPLGRLGFYPAAAGLMGGGLDATSIRSLNGQMNSIGYPVNGLPGIDNFARFYEPLIWTESGTDSEFRVEVTVNRDCILNAADVVAAAGTVQVQTSPADGALGTFADICVRLVGTINQKRSAIR